MTDLYRQLGVIETADEGQIRAALVAADASIREAAEFILLDPRRRDVYDRNRRVLVTVGRLRANLGLNLTRFWPRSRFADFTVDLAPPTGGGKARALDPMAIAWAFGVRPPGTTRTRGRFSRIAVAVAVLCLGAAAAALWWWMRHAGASP